MTSLTQEGPKSRMRECLQDLGRDGRQGLVPVLGGTYLTFLQGSGDREMEGTGQWDRKVSTKTGGREGSQVVRLLGPLSLPRVKFSPVHCLHNNCISQCSLSRGSLNEELAKSGAAWKF